MDDKELRIQKTGSTIFLVSTANTIAGMTISILKEERIALNEATINAAAEKRISFLQKVIHHVILNTGEEKVAEPDFEDTVDKKLFTRFIKQGSAGDLVRMMKGVVAEGVTADEILEFYDVMVFSRKDQIMDKIRESFFPSSAR